MKNKLNKKGFTIIEVLIILAIAALILVIVLIAIPQLQRTERNYRRKSDASRLIANVRSTYATNYNNFPASCSNVADAVPDCFNNGLELAYYSHNSDKKLQAISFANIPNPVPSNAWLYTTLNTNDNDPSCFGPSSWYYPGAECFDSEVLKIRSFARCTDDNQLTPAGAVKSDLAVQFMTETGNGYTLQCIEG